MKPIDINSGKYARACEFCERVIPKDDRLSHDMRLYTCIAPGGTLDKRFLIDEPCTTEDSKLCSVRNSL